MSSKRAAIFAGKARKSTSLSRARGRYNKDKAGFKKAFGTTKGYGSKLKDFMR